MFLNHHPVPAALVTRVALPIFRARTLTRLADDLLLHLEVVVRTSIEVSQRDMYLDLHIRTSSLSTPKVSATAEEATEQIERIVPVSSPLPALLMLLHSLVAVLVVDLPYFSVDKDIVSFGYFDEFLVRRLIVRVLVGVELFGEAAVGFFDLSVAGVLVEAEELETGVSWTGARRL